MVTNVVTNVEFVERFGIDWRVLSALGFPDDEEPIPLTSSPHTCVFLGICPHTQDTMIFGIESGDDSLPRYLADRVPGHTPSTALAAAISSINTSEYQTYFPEKIGTLFDQAKNGKS